MSLREDPAPVIAIAVLLFWSAVGFPFVAGALIMLFRPAGPSMLAVMVATVALFGFTGRLVLVGKMEPQCSLKS